MDIYRTLCNIKYKGKIFKVLSNKYHQKYFLRILDDGSLLYPTFDEFKELYFIYTSNKYYELEKKQNKYSQYEPRKKYKLDPMIIIDKATKTLATLTAVLFAIEVGIIIKSSNDSTKIKEISEGVYTLDTIQEEDGNKIPICSSTEFKKYLDVKNPSYDQVKKLIIEKENLDSHQKSVLLTGLDNIQKQLGEIDLSILYYNISRMNIITQDREEMKNDAIEKTLAYYDPMTGNVVINSDGIDDVGFCHEVLGHQMTEAYIEGKAYTTARQMVFSNIDQYQIVYNYGMTIEEAKAEIIGEIACGVQIGEYNSAYNQSMEFLRVCMETTGVTLQDIIQKGVPYLIEKMIENDIDNPIDHIENMDAYLLTYINSSEVTPVQIPTEEFDFGIALGYYMLDFVDDKMIKGVDVEDLSQGAYDIINNSYFEYVTDGQENVSMQNIANIVKDSIESDEFAKSVLPVDKDLENDDR